MSEQDIKIGEIRGVLEIMCWLNSYANHGCYSVFEALEKKDSIAEAVRARFGGLVGRQDRYTDSWRENLSTALYSWFFSYRLQHHHGVSFIDKRKVFQESTTRGRRQFVEDFVCKLEELGEVLSLTWIEHVYEVNVLEAVLEMHETQFYLLLSAID